MSSTERTLRIFLFVQTAVPEYTDKSWPRGEHDDKRVRFRPQGAIVSGFMCAIFSQPLWWEGIEAPVCGRLKKAANRMGAAAVVELVKGLPNWYVGRGFLRAPGPHGMGPTEARVPL